MEASKLELQQRQQLNVEVEYYRNALRHARNEYDESQIENGMLKRKLVAAQFERDQLRRELDCMPRLKGPDYVREMRELADESESEITPEIRERMREDRRRVEREQRGEPTDPNNSH